MPRLTRPALAATTALALAALAGFVAPAAPAVSAPAPPASLSAGGRLASGAALQSPGGRYRLTMQTDGNLVERRTFDSTAVWTTRTAGHPGAALALQSDGNLVLRGTNDVALWSSRSTGRGAVLSVQDDGNLVVRAAGRVAWSKGADTTGERTDTLRAGGSWTDGHVYRSLSGAYWVEPISGALLLFHGFGAAVWTGGRDQADVTVPTVATLQTDGNLVLRARGVIAWQTGTAGTGSANTLQIQDDGNLVLRTSAGRAVWASNTAGR